MLKIQQSPGNQETAELLFKKNFSEIFPVIIYPYLSHLKLMLLKLSSHGSDFCFFTSTKFAPLTLHSLFPENTPPLRTTTISTVTIHLEVFLACEKYFNFIFITFISTSSMSSPLIFLFHSVIISYFSSSSAGRSRSLETSISSSLVVKPV